MTKIALQQSARTLLVILLFSSQTFAAPGATAFPNVVTYGELVHAIREAKSASQGRLDQAVDQEKVREAWETGKLIDQHVLHHKERADYYNGTPSAGRG